jgi:hypothetical protein
MRINGITFVGHRRFLILGFINIDNLGARRGAEVTFQSLAKFSARWLKLSMRN